MPSPTCPCWEASISAEPRNAPTQGVHPTENTTPNTTEEKKFRLLVSTLRRPPRNSSNLSTPKKFRPNRITTRPHTRLTAVW